MLVFVYRRADFFRHYRAVAQSRQARRIERNRLVLDRLRGQQQDVKPREEARAKVQEEKKTSAEGPGAEDSKQ